jgi:diguanylate cyclase (GGDEF)-like protein
LEARLESARVATLFAVAKPAYYGGLAVGAMLLVVLWGRYPDGLLLTWFSLLAVVTLARRWLHQAFQRSPSRATDATLWENRFALSTLTAGALWAYVPAVLIPHEHELLEAAVVIIVGGVIVSGGGLLAASARAVYALITLPLIALIAQLLSQPDGIHRMLALAVLLFGFLAVRMSRGIRDSIVQALRARLRNEALLEERIAAESALKESEQKLREAVEAVRFLAYHDPLTGLPNRRLLEDRLKQAVYQAQRRAAKIAVIAIDLDDFKRINDSGGHAAGDAVLREVAQRLGACVRKADTLARHGGDEFVVVIAGVEAESDCQIVAEKMLRALASEITVEGASYALGASIGISIFPADAGDAELLLRNADAAMYRAKHLGRNTYRFYGH